LLLLEFEAVQMVLDTLAGGAQHMYIAKRLRRYRPEHRRLLMVAGLLPAIEGEHLVLRNRYHAALIGQPPKHYAMLVTDAIVLGLILMLLGLPTALRSVIGATPHPRDTAIDAHRVCAKRVEHRTIMRHDNADAAKPSQT